MKIGVIGFGALGSAIVEGLIRAKISSADIFVSDVDERKLDRAKSLGVKISNNQEICETVDVIILAVKPRDFNKTVEELKKIDENKALVSFVAGLKIEKIASEVKCRNIFRGMPNLSVKVCDSIIGLTAFSKADNRVKDDIIKLLSMVGEVIEVEERFLDTLTSISGSGIAFASEIIKAFYEAGVMLGLDHETAKKISLKVFSGTTKLLAEEDFDKIFKLVATPAGTTIEGVYVLEKSGVRGAIIEAIKAASDKASKLLS
ncbi:MAG: pyrroline-5-carboxylate reductase [Nitrososphaeria archaeon]|nr:pyrroline-5-carboxylate reductase [Nitrososphaeria archaeon]